MLTTRPGTGVTGVEQRGYCGTGTCKNGMTSSGGGDYWSNPSLDNFGNLLEDNSGSASASTAITNKVNNPRNHPPTPTTTIPASLTSHVNRSPRPANPSCNQDQPATTLGVDAAG